MQPSGEQRNRPDRPLSERRALARDLARHVGDASVLWNDVELLAYDVDGFTLAKFPPDLVVLPRTTAEVSAILAFARARQWPVTARGAGTGLAGGALAEEGGILLVTARMDQVLEVDAANRFAVVQPGVVNTRLSEVVAPQMYACPEASALGWISPESCPLPPR